MESDLGLNLLVDPNWKDVGLVLRQDASVVSIPLVTEVGDQYYRTHK